MEHKDRRRKGCPLTGEAKKATEEFTYRVATEADRKATRAPGWGFRGRRRQVAKT